MAIIASVIDSSGSATGTSASTASITASAGKLYIVIVGTKINASTPNTPTMSGASQTWTQIVSAAKTTAQRMRTTAFRALPSSGGSGALTIDFAGQSQERIGYIVIELTGIDDSGGSNGSAAVVQSSGAEVTSGTSWTINLSAFGKADNLALGGINLLDPAGITPGSGFSELAEVTTAESNVQAEISAASDTSVDWTFDSAYGAAVAMEIKAAAEVVASDSSYSYFM